MPKKSKKTETQAAPAASPKKRLKKLLTKRNIVLGIIVLFFLVQYIQLQSLFGTFNFLEGRDTSLITEIGQIKDSYTKIGTDLNEVREFLRLPTESYAVIDTEMEDAEQDSEKNENQMQLALFQYMDYLAKNQQIEKNVSTYTQYLYGLTESELFSVFLSGEGLQISDVLEDDLSATVSVLSNDGDEILVCYLAKDQGVLYRKTFEEKIAVSPSDYESFEGDTTLYITEHKDSILEAAAKVAAMRDKVYGALTSEDLAAKAAELGITIADSPVEVGTEISYQLYNKSEEIIGEVVIDTANLKIRLIDSKDSSAIIEASVDSLDLISFIEKLDTMTFLEKKVAQAKADIEATLNDGGFKSLMEEYGMSVAAPREYDQRLFYDIYLGETHVSSIVLEKTTGVVNIVQPDGTQAENLLFFDPDFKKKTLVLPNEVPDYGDQATHDDNTFNILIAGKHGSLVDTMIFAHIDEVKREIRMVSIPRDLYYNGRKINAFAHYYGMPELKRVLSDITGYKLDKYILIDMYAFIDVIDLIGGIDIHLDSAVIDPTYKTIDDGVVGTLHYEPGDYHLGGKEALRLARTRHTSSDFARAARQQMILEALQNKARNFGFGDADTIYEIAKTVLNQTETDVGLEEAIAYYFRYQNYEIVSNDVMSSGNVLYVPPYITSENCARMEEEAAAAGQGDPGCANQNHAYTLLPRGDNWNIVKWFFRENFDAIEG